MWYRFVWFVCVSLLCWQAALGWAGLSCCVFWVVTGLRLGFVSQRSAYWYVSLFFVINWVACVCLLFVFLFLCLLS